MPFVSEDAIERALPELSRSAQFADLLSALYLAPGAGSRDFEIESPTGSGSPLSQALDVVASLFSADEDTGEEADGLHTWYENVNSDLHSYFFPFAAGGAPGSREVRWKKADYNRSGVQRRLHPDSRSQEFEAILEGYDRLGSGGWRLRLSDDYEEQVFARLLDERPLSVWHFTAWVLRYVQLAEVEDDADAFLSRAAEVALEAFNIDDELVADDEEAARQNQAWFFREPRPDPDSYLADDRVAPATLLELCLAYDDARPETLTKLRREIGAGEGSLWEMLRETASGPLLEVDDSVLRTIESQLAGGHHLLLVGPPGTGKSTLADNIGRAATRGQFRGVRAPSSHRFTTAAASWTTFDTIGGYVPERSGEGLVFKPGIFLQALDEDSWLVVDEINRADADKAFGQFLTILSRVDAPVDLPFEVTASGGEDGVDGEGDPVKQVRIMPPSRAAEAEERDHLYAVPEGWRLIGTMNTFDKNTLFRLSYAFMRRFAVVFLDVPSVSTTIELARSASRGGLPDDHAENFRNLLNLASEVGRPIGPAIAIDMANYLAERTSAGREVAPADDREPGATTEPPAGERTPAAAEPVEAGAGGPDEPPEVPDVVGSYPLLEAIVAHVLPQMEGLPGDELRQFRDGLLERPILPREATPQVERVFDQLLDLAR